MTAEPSIAELVRFVMADDQWSPTWRDLTEVAPNVGIDEAYRIQFEAMRQRCDAGDRLVGYKAAATSIHAQQILDGFPSPTVGTILASRFADTGAVYRIRPGKTYVEAEIAITLGEDLRGRHVTAKDAARATACLCPALEIAPWSPTMVAGKRSIPHGIATHKTDGLIVVGPPVPPERVRDLRLEGALLQVDGRVVGSATGVEAMGNPFEVVAAIARLLAEHSMTLQSGMLVMTGSLLRPYSLANGVRAATAEFANLGRVDAAFIPSREDLTDIDPG